MIAIDQIRTIDKSRIIKKFDRLSKYKNVKILFGKRSLIKILIGVAIEKTMLLISYKKMALSHKVCKFKNLGSYNSRDFFLLILNINTLHYETRGDFK